MLSAATRVSWSLEATRSQTDLRSTLWRRREAGEGKLLGYSCNGSPGEHDHHQSDGGAPMPRLGLDDGGGDFFRHQQKRRSHDREMELAATILRWAARQGDGWFRWFERWWCKDSWRGASCVSLRGCSVLSLVVGRWCVGFRTQPMGPIDRLFGCKASNDFHLKAPYI
jgi:hypothetical protein